jgi:Ca-activated chloride channel family protein
MKKSHLPIILIVLFILFAVIGHLRKKDVNVSGPGSSPETPQELPPAEPGVWPPPDPKGGTPNLAPNLMAKNYYMVFDGSGSMKDTDCTDGTTSKAEVAKKAIAEFAKSVPKDANLGLLTFDAQGIVEKLPLGVDNRSDFIDQVNALNPGGATPLKSAITQAVARLTDEGRRQLGYGEYHLVIVTDGEAYPEDQNPSAIVEKTLSSSPILIHTIGFCIGETHSLNQPGRTIYLSADNPEALSRGLKQVLAESEKFDVNAFH